MKAKPSTRPLLLSLILLLPFAAPTRTQTQGQGNNLAPGAPGRDAQWPSAGKEAVGTSNTLESKVWFTLRGGVMDEVYYPTVDIANSQVLQFFLATEGGSKVETEAEGTTHRIEVLDPQALTFRQVNTAKSGAWAITKTYVTDPERSSVLMDVDFRWTAPGPCRCALYLYYDPSLNNSGMHDSAWTDGDWLVASDADKASALTASVGLRDETNGYLGTSDGLTRLRAGRLTPFARAADGNVVQVARVNLPVIAARRRERFNVILSFGREPAEAVRNGQATLRKGFEAARAEYEQGWREYVGSLRRVEPKYQRQFEMAAMVLKAHEDKTYRGAMIASLSVPWGGGASANEPVVGGYHLVWSRDLYQVATAFHALGDKASADRALDYLFRIQQKPDGSFPQNSWLDGRPFWGSLQLDEVAYPLVLAWQLGRTDNETWVKHVRPAADFIVKTGPWTPQERWEEESGYSPSTIAAEIAGLVCAAEIARRNGDDASAAIYTAAADDWARNVEAWTATTTGPYGDRNYYLRVTENDDPNDGEPRELNNGAGTFDEREVVDAGFLELVRLGIKPPQDPLVAKSLAVVDRLIRVETPNGASFYRYNHDGYGEMDDGRPWNWDGKYTGKGRLWALLAGERGQYELARGQRGDAARRLDAMLGFANAGLMIPEQVWDKTESPRPDLKFGEGTGSATPLAWSMAQFIRLAANLQEGRNLDTPDIVEARYVKRPIPARANADFFFPADGALRRMEVGKSFRVTGSVREGARAFALFDDERRELRPDSRGRVEFDVPVRQGEFAVAVGVVSPTGATFFRRLRARGLTAEEIQKAEHQELKPELIKRLKAARVSPLVEGGEAIFIYRGTAKSVQVVGDFTEWAPASLNFRDVPGGGVKFVRVRFPKGARAEYKLIADGEWLLDPLNPNRNDNGVGGENSFFVMPEYRGAQSASNGLRGRIERLEVPGDARRKVQVYLPPGYAEQPGRRFPVLYMQDGSQFIELGRAAEIADRLIAGNKVEPFIVVFIDPIERMKEYWANDAYADWMARTLVPLVDSRYRTRAEREGRALLGASLGGVTSIWAALRHPDVFARVGAHSPSFQIDEERVIGALAGLDEAARAARPFRFYIDSGLLEPVFDRSRRVQVMLAAKGYPVTYRETPSGHNYTTWRDRLEDAYMALWAN
ncbi:MAG TPA: glucan 1,4-alpha-glucosidase, partial [Pyrinomonadaceae bacterium]|nr:glucan 1,4-alpha-glucosidase [Pyrinomonadaceae bacterium]